MLRLAKRSRDMQPCLAFVIQGHNVSSGIQLNLQISFCCCIRPPTITKIATLSPCL